MSDVFADAEIVEPTPAHEVADMTAIMTDLFVGYTGPVGTGRGTVSNKDPKAQNLEEDFW
jgi:hypothetical protein